MCVRLYKDENWVVVVVVVVGLVVERLMVVVVDKVEQNGPNVRTQQLYLSVVVVQQLLLLTPVRRVALVLLARIERIDDDLLGAFDLGTAEWTALKPSGNRNCGQINSLIPDTQTIMSLTCPSESTCQAVRHGVQSR